jgi:hypothetical protein
MLVTLCSVEIFGTFLLPLNNFMHFLLSFETSERFFTNAQTCTRGAVNY